MVSQLMLNILTFIFFIGYSNGVNDYHNAFSTLTSNVDTFCSMPQWDSIAGTDLTGPPPYQDLYDSFVDDGGARGKRSLSVYYPPMVLPPASLSPWHQCQVPQILTIDSSVMAKPLMFKSESLPMCVQMMEIPGTVGTPVCGPMTYEPEYAAEVIQPVMASGMSAPCKAAIPDEAKSPCAEVATTVKAAVKPEEQNVPTETSEESPPVAGLLAKVFTPSALAELSKIDEKTDKSEGSNVKRQTLPDLPLQDAVPLKGESGDSSSKDMKTNLLKDALGDNKNSLAALLPVLSLLNAAKQASSSCSCSCSNSPVPPFSSDDSSSHESPAPASASSNPPSNRGGLLNLDASLLGSKGLLNLDANVLKLLGLDLNLLGPKGLLNLDAHILKSSTSPSSPSAPAPATSASSGSSSNNGGLLNLDASLLGPKGLLNLDASVLKLLGLDLNLLGPKGVLNIDASIPNHSSPPASSPPPSSPKTPSGSRGVLGVDASLLGSKGVLDLDASVLNLLGLDLNLLGPKGVLNLGAHLPNTPSKSATPPPPPLPPPPTSHSSASTKMPLNPTTVKLLLKLLGPRPVLAILSKALGPSVLMALLKAAAKPCPPPKCCPCPPRHPGGLLDIDEVLLNADLPNIVASNALLDVDLALLPTPALEIPASPVSQIYEIYGNGYDPIVPICTKTCTVPIVPSVRPESPRSSRLRALRTIHPVGAFAKLIEAPDADTVQPTSKDALSQVPSVPTSIDALPQVPPGLNTTEALPPSMQPTEDTPNPIEEASNQENSSISTTMKALPNSGDNYSLAKSLSLLMSVPRNIEEPTEVNSSSITESTPTTGPLPSRSATGASENTTDTEHSSKVSTDIQEFSPPLEPDAEFIDQSECTDLPQKMNLLSDTDSSCRRTFLETISRPVLKHFTYQLELPH